MKTYELYVKDFITILHAKTINDVKECEVVKNPHIPKFGNEKTVILVVEGVTVKATKA